MKRLLAFLLAALFLLTAASAEEEFTFTPTDSHILVACFSCTGNTWALAEYAADFLRADLFRIEPDEPYTDDDLAYWVSDCRANREMNDDACRPALKATVPNMAQYDIVILASPTWWGQAPRLIETFIESHDLTGKTLLHFSTSGSSGYGRTGAILAALTGEDVTWREGKRFPASASAKDIENWLISNGIEPYDE